MKNINLIKDRFIKKSKKIYGNKFSYSSLEYKNGSTPIKIRCSIHGDIFLLPVTHLRPNSLGCKKCNLSNSRDKLSDFINKSRKIHLDFYDYSESIYINSRTKIKIICPEHGEFYQTPNAHIYSRNGCPKCGFDIKVSSFKHSHIHDLGLNYIYILKIFNNSESFYKIGITVQSPKKRCQNIVCTSNKEYIANVVYNTNKVFDTKTAIDIEDYFSSFLEKYIPDYKFSGYTECYYIDDLELIINKLKSYELK